jgi:hypothetical protein
VSRGYRECGCMNVTTSGTCQPSQTVLYLLHVLHEDLTQQDPECSLLIEVLNRWGGRGVSEFRGDKG